MSRAPRIWQEQIDWSLAGFEAPCHGSRREASPKMINQGTNVSMEGALIPLNVRLRRQATAHLRAHGSDANSMRPGKAPALVMFSEAWDPSGEVSDP